MRECEPNVAKSFPFSGAAKALDFYVTFLDFWRGQTTYREVIFMFSPETCSLNGPLVACVALLASLPTTDGQRRSGLRGQIHTVFANPACS